MIQKLKNTVPWTYLVNDFENEEIVGTFYGKLLQKAGQTELKLERVIKKEGDELTSNGMAMIVLSIAKLLDFILTKKRQPFGNLIGYLLNHCNAKGSLYISMKLLTVST